MSIFDYFLYAFILSFLEFIFITISCSISIPSGNNININAIFKVLFYFYSFNVFGLIILSRSI